MWWDSWGVWGALALSLAPSLGCLQSCLLPLPAEVAGGTQSRVRKPLDPLSLHDGGAGPQKSASGPLGRPGLGCCSCLDWLVPHVLGTFQVFLSLC